MKTVTAYCWANGIIEVAPSMPEGALPLIRGNARKIREALEVLATHGYDGVTRLVPKSIAWCEGDMDAAVDDVLRFSKRLEAHIEKAT